MVRHVGSNARRMRRSSNDPNPLASWHARIASTAVSRASSMRSGGMSLSASLDVGTRSWQHQAAIHRYGNVMPGRRCGRVTVVRWRIEGLAPAESPVRLCSTGELTPETYGELSHAKLVESRTVAALPVF